MIFPTQIIGTRVRVGQSGVKVLSIVNFTRVSRKRAPNLAIQSYMLNRTINFTRGRGTGIHNINIHSIQSLSHNIYFSRK